MTNEPAHRAGALAVLATAAALATWSCSSPREPAPPPQEDTDSVALAGPAGSSDEETLVDEEILDEPIRDEEVGEGILVDEEIAEDPVLTDAELDPPAGPTTALEPFTVTLPGGLVEIEMLPVPGGTYLTADGAKELEPFYMARTETTWDAYDVLVFRLDLPEEQRLDYVDGVSRPTKPYISVDRGFGHAGYPALSMSAQGAQAFCDWLSEASGRRFRLPTTLEFEWAARAMSATPYGCGDAAGLADHAWFRDNSGRKTHPVGERSPNVWGLHDLHGNAAEWALDEGGRPVVCGGAFRDSAEKVGAGARREPSAAWNASDPQMPKSAWWLADANFVGFRIVCDPVGPTDQ